MTARKLAGGLLLIAAVAAALPAQGQDLGGKKFGIECDIIYVPTEQEVVEKMLDMAKVKKSDIVYDLGCGDGRIVATAAKKYGAKGVGVDIDPDRIKDSHKTLKKFDVEKMVEIREGDALKVKDLDKATVIMLYMLPPFMEKLEKQAKSLKPGTRIVAHDFPFPNWKPDVTVEFRGPARNHNLYMWTVPERKVEEKK
jgi:ubiquinone/menaquinone biosynthesis C-methylase UbiE